MLYCALHGPFVRCAAKDPINAYFDLIYLPRRVGRLGWLSLALNSDSKPEWIDILLWKCKHLIISTLFVGADSCCRRGYKLL